MFPSPLVEFIGIGSIAASSTAAAYVIAINTIAVTVTITIADAADDDVIAISN